MIPKSSTSNPHVAEERNIAADDSGINEEDKCVSQPGTNALRFNRYHRYAGVVRGANAYVPPARRAGSGNNVPQVTKPASSSGTTQTSTEIPKVSVTDSSSSKPTSPPAGAPSPSTKVCH